MPMQISISNAIGGGGGAQGGGTPTPPFSNVNSFLFDGIDEKMFSTANYTDLNGTQSFSISFWIKPIDINTGIVWRLGSQSGSNRLACLWRDNESIDISFNTSSYYHRTNAGSVPLNQWTHIVYTFDGTQTSANRSDIYINGVNANGTTTGVTVTSSAFDGTLELGGTGTSGTINFGNNYIEEIAVWDNTTLTETQSNELFNGGTPTDLNNIASGLTQPTTWFRMGDLAVWNGTNWTMTDVNGGTVVTSSNVMQESSRTTDVPPTPFSNTKSIALGGVDSFVTMGNASSLNFERTDSFSISTWVKRGSFAESQFLFGKMNSTGNFRGYLFYIPSASDSPQLLLRRDTSFTSQRLRVESTTTILDNNWHNLIVTYDGSSVSSGVKIYVDGVSTTTTTSGAISDSITTPAPVNIGAYGPYYLNDFSCDEVSVFNSELSASDVTSIYNSGVPNDISSLSPLSWWRCGDGDTSPTLTDNGSGGNDGTMENFSTFSTDVPTIPFSTKSIALDGIDDYYINVADNSNLSFGNGVTDSPFSISTWVKMNDATKFRAIGKYGATNIEYLLGTGGSDTLVFNLYDNSTGGRIGRQYSTAITSFEGQWIHLAATYNGNSSTSGLKIYLNGTRVDNTNSTFGTYVAMENTTQPLFIGKLTTTYADGNIDETAVFNSELSASDVTSIYNGGVPNDIASLSPVSWWRCGDGDTSPTLTDNGSGGNDGTMANFTTFSTDVPT